MSIWTARQNCPTGTSHSIAPVVSLLPRPEGVTPCAVQWYSKAPSSHGCGLLRPIQEALSSWPLALPFLSLPVATVPGRSPSSLLAGLLLVSDWPPHGPSVPSRITRAPYPGTDWTPSLSSWVSLALTGKFKHLNTPCKTLWSGPKLCFFQEVLLNLTRAAQHNLGAWACACISRLYASAVTTSS